MKTANPIIEQACDTERGQQVLAVIESRPCEGIPIWQINPMEWCMIDRLAGEPEGTYVKDPVPTYRKMLLNSDVCVIDQWIPDNPLSLGARGFTPDAGRGATTGAEQIVVDNMVIDSPEAAVAHMEKFSIPVFKERLANFDAVAHVAGWLDYEASCQEAIGDSMLKLPYSFPFPTFDYGTYGYENYFMAFAQYPDVIEQVFSANADLCAVMNRAVAPVFSEGRMPRYARLDHDMADSRGTLVRVEELDRLWFPHFERAIKPLLDAAVRAIWHCDGNLMAMVPRLLDVGIKGFQGFEYEHGMDYESICKMRTRDGDPLLIIAGVSVTSTLPYGTPDDVRKQMAWLVEHGPPGNLCLACSSSITPGVPWENLQALVEGFHFYRTGGSP